MRLRLDIDAVAMDDRLCCFRLARDVGLGLARFNNITPYPGCKLYDIAQEQGRLTIHKNWSNFNSAGAASSRLGSSFALPYVPEGTAGGALQGKVLLTNMLFYSNPRKLSNMITPTRKPSGIDFELTFRQLLKPVKIVRFVLAVTTMVLRTLWFLVAEKERRRFLWAILTDHLPDFEPAVRRALDEDLNQ